jgi:hypothetical protein
MGSAFWLHGRKHHAVGCDMTIERALPHLHRAKSLPALWPSCVVVRSTAGTHCCARVRLRLRQAVAAVPRRVVVRACGHAEPLWPLWCSLHHSIHPTYHVKPRCMLLSPCRVTDLGTTSLRATLLACPASRRQRARSTMSLMLCESRQVPLYLVNCEHVLVFSSGHRARPILTRASSLVYPLSGNAVHRAATSSPPTIHQARASLQDSSLLWVD